jgi:iron complex outermembrane receptor protein
MRLKSVVLCSTSFAALAMIATPAAAQPAAQDEPAPQAQEMPGDPEAGAPQTDDAVQTADAGQGEESIVVTGIRRSLQSAQNIRRNSEQIVDSVVAEDIGKLPDLAVSDTAARIPGVQVIRTGGEASTVLVRGLPDFTTTYNGREIFTAERREVALQDFPSANIAALEVFKTTTANLVEAGLSGQVNVRSRRPFDFQGTELAGSVWALYTTQAGEWNPNFNALASTRWDVGAGEMGLLVNVSRTQMQFLDSEPSNTDFVQTFRIEGDRLICCGPTQARLPDIQRLFYREGNRVRPSVNAAFQWRPSTSFELYAEFLWQGFRNQISDRLVAVPLYNGGSYSNLVFRAGSNALESGTVTGLADPIFTFQGGTYNQTDTYQYAVGGIYDAGPLRVTADFARTDSRFTGSTESVDRIFTGQATTAVDFDLTTPQFTIRNFDVSNPNNYLFDGLYEEAQVSEGDDWQGRVDAEYDFDESVIRSIQLGARYTTRDAHREFCNRFAGFRGRGINASLLPLDFELARRGFRGTDVQSGFETWLTPTYRSIRDNRVELREFVIANGPFGGFGTWTTEAPVPNPASVYDASEETLAGYGQVNFDFGEVADATIGMRVVRTDTEVTGNTIVEGVVTPVTLGSAYTDWLPNVSLRLRPKENIQVRLSFTETRTRPTFEQLNPSFNLGPPDPLQNNRRTGSGGNPFLQPFSSENYDASIEYYFRRTGFAALSLFRRDIEGFIQTNTQDFDLPGIGPVRVSVPVNTRQGRIQGAEAQVTTFFDITGLPSFFHNFGVQANYTYLDARVEIFNPQTGLFIDDEITSPEGPGDYGGVSRHTVNLVGLYESGPVSGRLTYNWRSNYLDRRDIRGDEEGGFYREYADPPARVDLSLNFTPFENATIFFDWTNITGNPFRVNFSSARNGEARAQYVRFLRYEETTFSLGIRFRL